MKLEQSFEVAAPLDRVWAALIDVERVAPCLPGAAVTGRNDDGSYDGTFKVKIGPTSASYAGKLAMEQVDESVHSATMQAQGTDKRGQGGAKATIVSSLSDAGTGSTRVEVSTDYHITGRLARFGRGGMIEDISNRLLGEFAKCLQKSLAGEPEAAAAPQAAAAPAAPAAPGGQDVSSADGGGAPPSEAASQPGDGATGEAPAKQPPEPEADQIPTATPPAGVAPPMPESEPVQGLSLMASALWGQAKRNPAQLGALVLGFLVALRLFRRRR